MTDVPELPPEAEELRNELFSGYRTYMTLATGIVASIAGLSTGGLNETLPVELAQWGDVLEYILFAGICVVAAFYKAKTTKIGILAQKKLDKMKK